MINAVIDSKRCNRCDAMAAQWQPMASIASTALIHWASIALKNILLAYCGLNLPFYSRNCRTCEQKLRWMEEKIGMNLHKFIVNKNCLHLFAEHKWLALRTRDQRRDEIRLLWCFAVASHNGMHCRLDHNSNDRNSNSNQTLFQSNGK